MPNISGNVMSGIDSRRRSTFGSKSSLRIKEQRPVYDDLGLPESDVAEG